MRGKCAGCGQMVSLEKDDRGGLRGGACGCGRSGEYSPRQEATRPHTRPVAATEAPDARMVPPRGARRGAAGGGGGGGLPGGGAKRTACSCGRSHPSLMQSLVCLNLRAEVESTGGWVLHEVSLPLPASGPQPGSKKRGKRPVPPGRAFTIRVDFLAVWPNGKWMAVEAKNPNRVSRDWTPRAGDLRTWYGVDPRFMGLEERKR